MSLDEEDSLEDLRIYQWRIEVSDSIVCGGYLLPVSRQTFRYRVSLKIGSPFVNNVTFVLFGFNATISMKYSFKQEWNVIHYL